MLFLGALSIKVVNDRVGILGFWMPERRIDQEEFEEMDFEPRISKEFNQRRYHQKKKRKFSVKK